MSRRVNFNEMRRLSAILFLVLLTATSQPGAELMKLPLLIQHYQLHLSEKRSSSFTDFLEEHYLANHQDADEAADSELPFKSDTGNNLSLVYVTPDEGSSQGSDPLATSLSSSVDNLRLPQHSASIFHPPQLS